MYAPLAARPVNTLIFSNLLTPCWNPVSTPPKNVPVIKPNLFIAFVRSFDSGLYVKYRLPKGTIHLLRPPHNV
jgi:hypothetical protein